MHHICVIYIYTCRTYICLTHTHVYNSYIYLYVYTLIYTYICGDVCTCIYKYTPCTNIAEILDCLISLNHTKESLRLVDAAGHEFTLYTDMMLDLSYIGM